MRYIYQQINHQPSYSNPLSTIYLCRVRLGKPGENLICIPSHIHYVQQALRSKFLVTVKGWYWQTLKEIGCQTLFCESGCQPVHFTSALLYCAVKLFFGIVKGIFALCLANHMSNFTNQFLLQMAWKLRQSASFLITCMMTYQFAIITSLFDVYREFILLH